MFDLPDKFNCFRNGHIRDVRDTLSVNLAAAHSLIHTGAAAFRAYKGRDHAVQHFLLTLSLLRGNNTPVHSGVDTFELRGFRPVCRRILQLHLRRIQEEIQFFLAVILDLLVQIK